MEQRKSTDPARYGLAIAVGASLLALSGCGGDAAAGPDLFSVLPLVFVSEVDPKDSFAELVQDSDIVVIGHVTGVSVDPIDTITPAAELATGRYKISIAVTPSGGGQSVAYGTTLEVAPELAEATIREIEGASLPRGELLFALHEVDGWGYACTSADASLCPLDFTSGVLASRRYPEYPLFFRDPGDLGKASVADYVRQFDASVEIRGGD